MPFLEPEDQEQRADQGEEYDAIGDQRGGIDTQPGVPDDCGAATKVSLIALPRQISRIQDRHTLNRDCEAGPSNADKAIIRSDIGSDSSSLHTGPSGRSRPFRGRSSGGWVANDRAEGVITVPQATQLVQD
jgi:hypothetical protein